MMALVASDIDGTLCIRSNLTHTASDHGLAAHTVDRWQGGSAVTTFSGARAWGRLATSKCLIPATTRTMLQYRRLRWPGPTPEWAVILNGAHILWRGAVEPSWSNTCTRHARECGWDARHAAALLKEHLATCFLTDVSPGFFVKSHGVTPPTSREVAELREVARSHHMVCSVQSRSVYLSPRSLGKREALEWIAERAGPIQASAGDSAQDVTMLQWSPRAICPRKSEACAEVADTSVSVVDGEPIDQVTSIAKWLEIQSLESGRRSSSLHSRVHPDISPIH